MTVQALTPLDRITPMGKAHQTSHQYRILKTVASVVGFIIGTLVAVVVWVVVRPVFRGIGWIISLLTMIAVIYWLLTIF
ncbi:MAG: hypothetical protein HFJ90_09150 [Muribaculaceae bacterium]|nr:hypothetical protein [Muribaculaceae bacterium]